MPAFAWALPHTFRLVPAADNTAVTLTITGASGGQWSVLRVGQEWKLYQGTPHRPDADIMLDQDIAWRLFTRGVAQQVAREQMSFDGDPALGLQVLEMVSIIA